MIPTGTNIKTIHAEHGRPLNLGREGENNAGQVIFDFARWINLYGPGTVQLLVQRTGETTPYPAALTVDGSTATWVITAADTAVPGRWGKAELRYIVGDTLAKSETWTTIVTDALGEPSGTPPEAQQGWVDQVLRAGADVQETAAQVRADAERVDTALGQASWIGFELDDDGILYAVISPGFAGAQFALTDDGYLEVIYGT